jgi:hypothetical protein
MSLPAFYPPATRRMLGKAPGAWSGRGRWKIIWHTTETAGLPSYSDGAVAPHLTYYPAKRTWTQDYPLTRPAEAIRVYDDDQAIQMEIVCYSAKSVVDAYGGERIWVGNLTELHYQDLADFALWVSGYIDLPAMWPGRQARSYAQANTVGFRYTETEFLKFGGHLGHQHVPHNTHWDPGEFNWGLLMNKIGDDMPLTDDDIQKIAKAVVSYPGGSSVDNTPFLTLVSGTYRLVRATEAAVAALDLEGVSEAELDARVARLIEVLPARTIDALKAAL